jgi:hypothetical protein
MTEPRPANSPPPGWTPDPNLAPDDPFNKPRSRLVQEEIFLSFWRLVLLASGAWMGVYAWIGATWASRARTDLAFNTHHEDIQLGLAGFIGLQLGYYLFVSWSFRRWRDWGFAVWALALTALLAGLRYPI